MTLLITGSAGRIGSMLRLEWGAEVGGLTPLWTARRARSGVAGWDIGRDSPPSIAPGAVVLHLAGELRGNLTLNAGLTAEVCRLAMQAGARHMFLASTVAVYRPGPDDLPEFDGTRSVQSLWRGETRGGAGRAGTARPNGQGAGADHSAHRQRAGADALLGRTGPVVLDPVPGQAGGPHRSYVGPGRLAGVLAALIGMRAGLPRILNVAEPGVVGMADLLTAAGRDWRFGPPNSRVVPRVGVDTRLLTRLVPMPPATPGGIAGDLARLTGRWP